MQLKEKISKLTTANNYTRKQVPQYVKKCQQFADYIIKTDERNTRQNEKRTKLYEDLKQCRTQNIQKLIKYIFPLSQRISKCETAIIAHQTNALSSSTNIETQNINSALDVNKADLSVSATAETLNALAEATHTTYVRGRWVLQDSHGELQHVIVAPSLPGMKFIQFCFPPKKNLFYIDSLHFFSHSLPQKTVIILPTTTGLPQQKMAFLIHRVQVKR